MRTPRFPYLLLLLAALGLIACGAPSRGDDDDAADDDDLSADDDDLSADDDDVMEDDDDVLADDDDASDDDDDTEPPPTEGDSSVSGVWFVKYLDIAGDPYCQQAYEFTGTAEFSPFAVGGACTICTGEFVLLNLTEVTTTHANVTIPCVANTHFTVSANVGENLTDPSTGFGDFLGDQALIDRETAIAEGVTTSQQAGASSLPELHTELQANGLKLTHVGYIEAPAESSYFGAVGLHSVAVSPPGAPDYLPIWWYATQAGEEVVMSGSYLMGSFWQINSNSADADYDAVTFEGAIEATFTPPAAE
jgi:hypothetical protein